jgi:2-desacetyl-2-hydroxyethyl bacteriochlorophyllide A dehydrogenase
MGSIGDTMRVAVYRGEGSVPVEMLPTPKPVGPHDVLVEIAYCGICGTDLHAIVEASGRDGWGAPGFIGGHEWSGHVRAVGPSVTKWKVGDRVTSNSPACGECDACRSGRPSICRAWTPGAEEQGAWAEYLRKSEDRVLAIPEGVDLRAAALTEPLAVALHGVTRSAARPGDRVLVTGAGPIGTLTVVALHARGINDVTVSEPNAGRRKLAERLGARVVTPADLFPARGPGGTPFEAVIETSGSPLAATAGIDCLVPGGVMALVGVCMVPPAIDLVRILGDELSVVGSALYDVDGMAEALALLAAGKVPVDILVEPENISLEQVGEACAQLAGGQLAGKVMVVPS